jgi:hypothetical protein
MNAPQSIKVLRVAVAACMAILGGCATGDTVAPWDRGYLAETGMQWEMSPRESKLEGHVYTSKEASSGGNGAAGGGCGCN